MTKEEILKKHKQYMFPSVTINYKDPLVTDHASMQYVWDVEGKKYLDFCNMLRRSFPMKQWWPLRRNWRRSRREK